jgi:hypothetical protein
LRKTIVEAAPTPSSTFDGGTPYLTNAQSPYGRCSCSEPRHNADLERAFSTRGTYMGRYVNLERDIFSKTCVKGLSRTRPPHVLALRYILCPRQCQNMQGLSCWILQIQHTAHEGIPFHQHAHKARPSHVSPLRDLWRRRGGRTASMCSLIVFRCGTFRQPIRHKNVIW